MGTHPPPPFVIKVEAPITNHLRDFNPSLEKYKAMQKKIPQEDRNQEDYIFWVILFLEFKSLWNFETKSWHEHITNVQSLPYPLIQTAHYSPLQHSKPRHVSCYYWFQLGSRLGIGTSTIANEPIEAHVIHAQHLK